MNSENNPSKQLNENSEIPSRKQMIAKILEIAKINPDLREKLRNMKSNNDINDGEELENFIYENSQRGIEERKKWITEINGNFLYYDLNKFEKLNTDEEILYELNNLKSLRMICLVETKSSNPLKIIEKLTKLEKLEINYGDILDLNTLRQLTNLKELIIKNSKVNDISGLKNLKKLSYLLIYDTFYDYKITDISALKNLINLEEIVLPRHNIQDLSPIENLKNLKKINLSINEISDISPLINLDLTFLDISNNNIFDIRPLQNLIKLTSLGIGANKITDISALENLTNLQTLNMSCKNITDISPIKNLINLETLSLYTNPNYNVFPLSNLKKLNHLLFCSNKPQKSLFFSMFFGINIILNSKWRLLKFDLKRILPNCKIKFYQTM